jgi:DNA-binding MarR family transcriptional regulator
MQAVGLLVRRLRALAGPDELSMTEWAVLGRLVRNGPATTAELARAESMKPQSMGTTVAALEEVGLVERRPHPTDGRQMMIEVTEKGLAMRQNRRDVKIAWLAGEVKRLSDEERQTLFRAEAILRRLAER